MIESYVKSVYHIINLMQCHSPGRAICNLSYILIAEYSRVPGLATVVPDQPLLTKMVFDHKATEPSVILKNSLSCNSTERPRVKGD